MKTLWILIFAVFMSLQSLAGEIRLQPIANDDPDFIREQVQCPDGTTRSKGRLDRQLGNPGAMNDVFEFECKDSAGKTIRKFQIVKEGKTAFTPLMGKARTLELLRVVEDSKYDGLLKIKRNQAVLQARNLRRLNPKEKAFLDECLSIDANNLGVYVGDLSSKNTYSFMFDPSGNPFLPGSNHFSVKFGNIDKVYCTKRLTKDREAYFRYYRDHLLFGKLDRTSTIMQTIVLPPANGKTYQQIERLKEGHSCGNLKVTLECSKKNSSIFMHYYSVYLSEKQVFSTNEEMDGGCYSEFAAIDHIGNVIERASPDFKFPAKAELVTILKNCFKPDISKVDADNVYAAFGVLNNSEQITRWKPAPSPVKAAERK